MLIKSDARLELKFQVIIWRFLEPKWTLKRAQTSLEDEVFRDLGAPAPPEASRKPPGSHFGAFLDYFWSHFDAKIAPQTSTSIQNHFLASLPFPPAAIFEPPDLISAIFAPPELIFRLRGRFGAQPTGDPATEPLWLPRGRGAKRIEDAL